MALEKQKQVWHLTELEESCCHVFSCSSCHQLSWSSWCRPIQTSLAASLSQNQRLFESVWRCKDSKLQSSIWFFVMSDCMHQRLHFLTLLCLLFSCKEGISGSCHRKKCIYMWKKCRSLDQQDEKLAKSRQLYSLLSLHKMRQYRMVLQE